MIVRRVQDKTIEVTFPKPYTLESRFGTRLIAFAEAPGVRLVRDGEGISGVECEEKDFLNLLRDAGASKETLTGVRRALDESKKAQRERMRG